MIRFALAVAVTFAIAVPQARADAPLVVHAVEYGIGKFHREDDRIRHYGNENAWKNYVLPAGAALDPARTVHNADGSYSIFFSSLEDALKAAARVSAAEKRAIGVFNLTAHGLPGGMWFPKDVATRDSEECADWRKEAQGADSVNYGRYYSPVSPLDIWYFRDYAKTAEHDPQPCVAGLPEFKEILKRVPAFAPALAVDAQLTFISCIVGLGAAGEHFTRGLAGELLAPGSRSAVVTSLYFGLGDWSLPEGMGFWDYQNDAQLKHDMSVYPVNRSDREIMQPGSIRVATAGLLATSVIDGVRFVQVDAPLHSRAVEGTSVRDGREPVAAARAWIPRRVAIPGTGALLDLNR